MTRRSFYYKLIWAAAIGIAVCGWTAECRAGGLLVDSGYDLFSTDASSSNFPGLGNLMGVPLGTYNFGSGSVLVGDADTIIKRNQNVAVTAVGMTGTTTLSVFALQLETVTPVNFMGNGLADYYVTLESIRGGPASTGTMNITFNAATSGTFTSTLDLNLDIRKGSLTGPIVDSLTNVMLTNSGTSWSNVAPAGATLINGVNNKLNGTDTTNDFWPTTITEKHPGGGQHVVDPAMSTPEPSSWVLCITSGLMVSAYGRWARRRA